MVHKKGVKKVRKGVKKIPRFKMPPNSHKHFTMHLLYSKTQQTQKQQYRASANR
jgi:hypothetical protein